MRIGVGFGQRYIKDFIFVKGSFELFYVDGDFINQTEILSGGIVRHKELKALCSRGVS